MADHLDEDDLILDGTLLRDIARRRARLWVVGGLAALILLVTLGFFFWPQSFTSTVSMAVQQPSAGSSGLAAVLAGSGAGKRYLGVLTSRRAAEDVERQVHLQQLYGLRSEFEAVQMLMKRVVAPRDSPGDGLLYVDVTLPGPAYMARGQADFREKVRTKTAEIANAYARALRAYYIENDNDRDSVLLRGAEAEQRRARSEFESAQKSMLAYFGRLNRVDPKAVPSVDGGGNAQVASSELPSLYTELARTDTELRSAEAAETARGQATAELLKNPAEIPFEDELLNKSRAEVDRDERELANLRVQYGPDHWRVNEAKEKLRIAQDALNRQIAGVKGNRTTERIKSATEIEGLRAKRDKLQQQIAESEGRLREKRSLSTEYQVLRDELELRREALKTTESEAARLRLGTVSAQSRITVIDDAIPPPSGSPGPIRITAASLAIVLLFMVGGLFMEYVRRSRDERRGGGPTIDIKKAVLEEAAK